MKTTKTCLFAVMALTTLTLNAYPVEDIVAENGIWLTLTNTGTQIAHSATMIGQQAALVQSAYAQISNFKLGDVNTMADAMNAANKASSLGTALSSDAGKSIDKINKMTKDQDNPDGRLGAIDSVLDTAKATFQFTSEQGDYMAKNINTMDEIRKAGGDVAGTTAAIQAGNQLATQTNQQLQALDRSIGQQSRLMAAQIAAEQSAKKAQQERMKKIAESLGNIGEDTYKGETVNIPSWKFSG